MSSVKDYYKTLGVDKSASEGDIKKAYRKLARKCHPDLNPGDKSAEERFKSLSDAYGILADPKKKQQYDSYGTTDISGGGGYGGQEGFRPGGFSQSGGGDFGYDFGDIFGDILGGQQSARGTSFRKGTDIVAAIEVSLNEAFAGTTRKMMFKRERPCTACGATGVESSSLCPGCKGTGKTHTAKGFFRVADRCSTCGGTGRMSVKSCASCGGNGKTFTSENLRIKIPAGVDTGSTVKLSGKGNAGVGGAPSGDMKLRVTVSSHKIFERTGNDIQLQLPITFGEAALGAKVKVPTIDGSTMMTIPAGTQGGQKFKLSGKGFSRPRGGRRGDMFIIVAVTVPKGLDSEGKEAIENIECLYAGDPRDGMVEQ
jgi:molecular chaperone DnaJ